MKNKQYKIIAIGDTHGKKVWQKIVKQNKNADKFVFMGDYFDSFDISFKDQWNNFLDLIKFKKENMDKVVLLFANHEYHYMSKFSNDSYSGYQVQYSAKIEEVLKSSLEEELMQIAYADSGYLFTHAGLTKEWANNNLKGFENITLGINDLFKNKPEVFKFTPSTGLDSNGDSITQSPIWVRPRALLSNKVEGIKQVVGHTHQSEIDVSKDIIFIDILDTKNEYLIINNGIPKVGVLK